ncbi:hypothetical protein [Clostridium sp. FS41]|uniref:hypothetical protein n=1 Tax=Clostridium sp. FS41 TaxID=1609975 RepID=UPI0005D3EBFB|nr:hypothetical protein [Clostridium sp. FS41]KJJ74454.1 hypothetical protein CLFS41_11840 [Clostridium sp. FS41]
MAARILWDMHEAAVLFQAMLRVLAGEIKRKEAVSDVSSRLREIAIGRGIKIDEKYRNENGVSLQMNCLEYAYTEGQSGLHVTNGWYFDIVRIYKDEREIYEKLLREAKVMSESVPDNRKNFLLWLENNKPEKMASDIKLSISVLNILLQKNGTISSQLFDIDSSDEIIDLIENIKNNRGIRIHSRGRRADMLSTLNVYKEYLESNSIDEVIPTDGMEGEPQTASFTEKMDYSYTRPVSVEYFGEVYPVKNWSEAYVQTVSCFFDDYSKEIKSLIGKNIGGRKCVDITDEQGKRYLIAPKEITGGLYLETNCSASGIISKIKQLMDICGIDYSDVIIRYMPKGASQKQVPSLGDSTRDAANKINGDFYTWLIEIEGLTAQTGKSYASGINNCDTFCREHDIGTGRIYGAESLDEINQNIDLLVSNAEFQAYNDTQHHRFTAALAKYKKYFGLIEGGQARQYSPIQQPKAKNDLEEINTDEQMRIRTTLELPRFEYGFKDDEVELYRFRASYLSVNSVECSLEDEQLLTVIRKMGFEFQGKVYLIADDEKQSIEQSIREFETQGVNIIYYESLYDLNSEHYFEAKIMSSEMLKAIMKNLLPDFRYRDNYFALVQGRQTELELVRNDILRVWGESVLRTFDELSVKLPLIPLDKIKFTLGQQSAFIWNSFETYARLDRFEADENEMENLVTFIDEKCEEYGRASLDELPFGALKDANPEFSDSAFIGCFCKLIEDGFDRNARILTRKGASEDTYTAVIEFCRKQEECTYDRLMHIAERVAGTIRQSEIVEAANAVMVRIDKDNFVADRLIKFDVDRIDTALDYIVKADFMGMREVTTFSIFPFCGYSWNLFLLESYCRRFSKKYRYDTRRANSSNSGAVVARSCTLSYHDIMVHAVARSGRSLSEDDVFDFLTEAGYIERKRYNNITLLINDAAELRERRE